MSKKILLVEKDAGHTIRPKTNDKKLNEGNLSFAINGSDPNINPNQTQNDNCPIYIDCILQKADVENKNGRIYSKALLEREIQRYNEQIQLNNAFGNTDHPDDSVVSLKENPHRITKIWWVDNIVYGTLELLVSEGYKKYGIISCSGDDICNKIKNYGATIGISSRGVGSLKEVGDKKYVQDDFELICWDLVQSPSTPNAYLFDGREDMITNTVKTYSPNMGNEERESLNMYDFNRLSGSNNSDMDDIYENKKHKKEVLDGKLKKFLGLL